MPERRVHVLLRWEARDDRGRPTRLQSRIRLSPQSTASVWLPLTLANHYLPLVPALGVIVLSTEVVLVLLVRISRVAAPGREALLFQVVEQLWIPFLSTMIFLIAVMVAGKSMRG